MRYRKLDSDGDFVTGHGAADFYADQVEAIAQSILTRLRLWRGEWFLDTAEGTPYKEEALGVRRLRTAGPAIRRRIATTSGVTEVKEFNVSYDSETRHLSVACTVATAYGDISIREVM